MPERTQKKVWLTVWLLLPVVLVGALYFAFPKHPKDSVAAKARARELAAAMEHAQISVERLGQGFTLRVHDRSGRAESEGPVFVKTSRAAQPIEMKRTAENWWEADVAFSASDIPLTYTFALGTKMLPALDPVGHPEAPHSPARVNERQYSDGTRKPVIEHEIPGWAAAPAAETPPK